MALFPRNHIICYPLLISVLLLAGCRDSEPTKPFYRDLSTDDSSYLLPGPSPWHAVSDIQKAKGKADWRPFREPSEPSEVTAKEAEDATADGETKAEIRELLTGYNEVAAEEAVDELLGYYVGDQQEALTPFLEAHGTLTDKLTALGATIAEKLPDQKDRADAALAKLGGRPGQALAVVSLEVVSETEVSGVLSPGSVSPTCRFIWDDEDEDWYIEMTDLATYEQVKPGVDALLASLDEWLAGLASGELSAEDAIAGVEGATAPFAQPGEGG
ncbi:MAG: hypothetical protein JSU63_11680 [Phycisphaerales bacterium]|nr:MAG: hypothetical protein JSU63_11680 [Phycisphaerales bacterium]